EVLSRKNGASRKHHKTRQLQQIITAVRHQGKTITAKISLFFRPAVAKALARQGRYGSTQVVLRNSKTPFKLKGNLGRGRFKFCALWQNDFAAGRAVVIASF